MALTVTRCGPSSAAGVQGGLRVVFMEDRCAEQGEDTVAVRLRMVEAALKIDAATLLVMRTAAVVEESAALKKQMDYIARARVRGVVGFAAGLLREAVDALTSFGGASGFMNNNSLQRLWRDANIATSHALLATDPSLEMYGTAPLGIQENITPFI